MELPVKNIVSEIDLKPSDALLPLYEVVVNSIISLKQTRSITPEDRKIQIQIERGGAPQILNFEGVNTIKSLKVIDNGEGFNDKNLQSYKTAYTHKNKEFGCKGVGRFTVLAAFDKIFIDSNFKNGTWKNRIIELDAVNEVRLLSETESVIQKNRTVVELVNCYNKDILDSTAISVNQIAEALMQHCLIYYLSDELPRIEVIDTSSNEVAIVNDLFENLATEREKQFDVQNYSFNCYITKSPRTSNRKNHYIYYCANSRVVGAGKNIARINNIFSYPLTENGLSYFLDVFVVSDYLNKKVYNARNGFTIPQDKNADLFDIHGITFQEIEEKLSDILKDEYNDFVKATQDRNVREIRTYITTKAPRYRRYANRPEILNSIPPNLTEEKMEEFLYKISYIETKKIDSKIERFIASNEVTKEKIDEIKNELIEKTAYNSDNLLDYMMRRKAIIEIFKKFLEADMAGKYRLEEDIHQLIFPMGVTHSEVNYESHNLWLLDERFATYTFIASDKPITTYSQKKSGLEADIVMLEEPVMFDNPITFGSGPSGEISSMVVFEFKRPGETAHQKRKADYRWEFSELIEKYTDEFLYGADKKNYRGRQVVIRKETPKFGYVVVDVIPKMLEEYNIGKGYRKTPFGTYYKIYPDLNFHIEVITFQKLIEAVETRHTPFFDKLFVK